MQQDNSVYADFHVHTCFSPCGHRDATIVAMVERAQAKGLAALGFADHVTPSPIPGCSFYDGQQIEVLSEMREIVEDLTDASTISAGVELLVGLEADYTLAGAACLDAAVLRLADHVVCSASHFHLPAAPTPRADTPLAKAELMVRMAREMLLLDGVCIWAHPFDCGAMKPLAPIMAEIDEATRVELITLANAREVAIEINGGAGMDPAYRASMAPFFGLAREMGARFSVTSDAHHPADFERLDSALQWARALQISDQALLTVDELRTAYRHKREARLSQESDLAQAV